MSYLYEENGLTPSVNDSPNEAPPEVPTFTQGFQNGNNNLYYYPHKGIFHPEPNTLICRGNCCYKYIGLYPILFGLGFGCTFIPIGIFTKMIVFTLVGSLIFLPALIVGICLAYKINVEVKFVVSYPMIEIITSSMLKTNKKIVNISEIGNIIFEYDASNISGRGSIYQSLHIMYTNGEQTDYFGFSSTPPCFTRYEVDYFNNEIKKLLHK